MKFRVFLADDHAVVRDGLRQLLSAQDDLEVCGEGADGRAVLNAPELAHCDVLVLDLSLPRVDGSEVLRRLRQSHPELPVVVLSMYPADQFAARVLRDGAWAYLSKTAATREVLDVIRRAAKRERITATARADLTAAHDALSPREFQVFMLLIRGRSPTEIAAELDLTIATVSTHLAKVRDKLSVRTNPDVVTYAHRAGLID